MLAGCAAQPHGLPAGPCSRCSPATCRTAAATAWSRHPGLLLDALERFRFGPAELDFLSHEGLVNEATPEIPWRRLPFGGDIWGYAEGDCYFPAGSPILSVVQASFAEAAAPLETIAACRSLTDDCAIASAASRMVTAAAGPAADRDGLAAHPRVRRRSPRPGPPTSPGSTPPRTWQARPGLRRAEHGDQPRTRSRCCTTASRHALSRPSPRIAGPRHHAAGGHLRRGPGGRRTAVELACPLDLGAVRDRQRRPARGGPRQVRALLDQTRRHQDPDRADRRP